MFSTRPSGVYAPKDDRWPRRCLLVCTSLLGNINNDLDVTGDIENICTDLEDTDNKGPEVPPCVELTEENLFFLDKRRMAKLLQHSVTNHKKTNNVFVGNTEDKLSTVPALISTIQTGHRAKSAAALQKITHRDGIIDEVNNFIRQTQASGSLHLSSVVDFIGESDFHPIYSLSIIVAPWLKVDPESNRYYFTEELEELVDRKIYTKVWLPGFGEYPIPSIHYNLIKYQIDAAWVQTQRQYAPQIDNRATLNYIEPGGGSFLGSTMTNILERVQAGFGVTGHDCQEVREYLIPERFRNHSNHSEKFLTVFIDASLDRIRDNR
eukprot:GHVH01012557.1.p1 GENE.GHVH01012557.1~~GHVH01012557.1.p1  ORF type:complete len:329 (+),score=41.48 GHVH01012557.1:24-989(+)